MSCKLDEFCDSKKELSKKKNKPKANLEICCSVCGRYFRAKWQLKEHARSHENKIHFKCPHCPSTFIRSSDMNKHLICHSNDRPYKCSICNKSFKTKPTKRTHEDTHNLNTYQCRYCGKMFNRYVSRSKHEQTHKQMEIIKDGNGKLKYKCMYCGPLGLFASLKFLEDHIVTTHNKKISSEYGNFNNTNKLKPKIFKCSICLEKFSTYKEHKDHIITFHPDNFSNIFSKKCTICKKSVSSSYLQYHMMAHKGVKPHICNHCDARFARKGELKKHEIIHQYKSYECNQCKQVFHGRKEFLKHKEEHLDNKFICNECNLRFRTGSNLRQHKLRWHARQHIMCKICDKEILNIDFNRHMKMAHEENEKLCHHCGKTFQNEYKLRKHLRVVHMLPLERSQVEPIQSQNNNKGTNNLPIIYQSYELKTKNNLTNNVENDSDIINISNKDSIKPRELKKKGIFVGECNVCGLKSTSKSLLKFHLQQHKPLVEFQHQSDKASQENSLDFPKLLNKEGIIYIKYECSEKPNCGMSELIKHDNGNITFHPTREVFWIHSSGKNANVTDAFSSSKHDNGNIIRQLTREGPFCKEKTDDTILSSTYDSSSIIFQPTQETSWMYSYFKDETDTISSSTQNNGSFIFQPTHKDSYFKDENDIISSSTHDNENIIHRASSSTSLNVCQKCSVINNLKTQNISENNIMFTCMNCNTLNLNIISNSKDNLILNQSTNNLIDTNSDLSCIKDSEVNFSKPINLTNSIVPLPINKLVKPEKQISTIAIPFKREIPLNVSIPFYLPTSNKGKNIAPTNLKTTSNINNSLKINDSGKSIKLTRFKEKLKYSSPNQIGKNVQPTMLIRTTSKSHNSKPNINYTINLKRVICTSSLTMNEKTAENSGRVKDNVKVNDSILYNVSSNNKETNDRLVLYKNNNEPYLRLTKPSLNETNPSLNENNPRLNETNPSLNETNPSLNENNPRLNEINPRKDEINHRINEINPTINVKDELNSLKGKQVLSIEDLEKLRGLDVDTLLDYLKK